MLSQNELKQINDINENIKEYISVCSEEKTKKSLADNYKVLKDNYDKYLKNLDSYSIALSVYDKTSSKNQLDPYVAGGIANGIAGPSAGLYSAVQQQKKNQEDKSYNQMSLMSAALSKKDLEKAEKNIRTALPTILEIISSCKEIIDYTNRLNDEKYCDAKRKLNSKNLRYEKEGYETLRSLGTYKDSQTIANNYASKYNFMFKISRHSTTIETIIFCIFFCVIYIANKEIDDPLPFIVFLIIAFLIITIPLAFLIKIEKAYGKPKYKRNR